MTDFNGFGVSEVHVESGSLQCQTRICLVNHFQGRVSCPYGQSSSDLLGTSSSPARCKVPGSDGQNPGDLIEVAVEAWDTDRPALDAVYCSCRCRGPDPNARYCACPSGFACTELIADLRLGRDQLAGSYCVREETAYRSHHIGGSSCATEPEHPACPDRSEE